MLTPNTSLYEWRTVFWIAFGVFNVTNIVYIIWASAEIQPFNDPDFQRKSRGSVSSNSEEDGQNKSSTRAIEGLISDKF